MRLPCHSVGCHAFKSAHLRYDRCAVGSRSIAIKLSATVFLLFLAIAGIAPAIADEPEATNPDTAIAEEVAEDPVGPENNAEPTDEPAADTEIPDAEQPDDTVENVEEEAAPEEPAEQPDEEGESSSEEPVDDVPEEQEAEESIDSEVPAVPDEELDSEENPEEPEDLFLEQLTDSAAENRGEVMFRIADISIKGKEDGEALSTEEVAKALLPLAEGTDDAPESETPEGPLTEPEAMESLLQVAEEVESAILENAADESAAPSEEPEEEVSKSPAPDDAAIELAPGITVSLTNAAGVPIPLNPAQLSFRAGSVILVISPIRRFTPGLYTLTLEITHPTTGETQIIEQDFAWGVLAMNPDKDRYERGDKADVHIGVLDDGGNIVCNADLSMEVQTPGGHTLKYSTDAGSIVTSETCGLKEAGFIEPDYRHSLLFAETGRYTLTLTATTENGTRSISQDVEVGEHSPMRISRQGATRLWPFAPSPMTISIEFLEDFDGSITELVPDGFEITNADGGTIGTIVDDQGDGTTITWEGSWNDGDTVAFSYLFDAPDISPEFYLLGPVTVQGTFTATEARTWQIANDDGAIRTWDAGGADTNWSTAANWSDDTVPTAADTALFDGTGKKNSVIDTGFAGTVSRLQITASHTGSVILSKNLTINENLLLSGGTLDMRGSGYTLTVKGTWTNDGATFRSGTGTVLLTGTGSTGYGLKDSNGFYDLVLNDGLLGYWKFDDGVGSTATDSSGYGNVGTLNGGMSATGWITTTPSLRFANPYALEFDGVNDYVNLTSADSNLYRFPANQNFSVAAWVKVASAVAGVYPTVVGNESANNRNGFSLSIDMGAGVPFFTTRTSCCPSAYGTTNIVDGSWHHLLGIRQGDKAFLYVNGELDATLSSGANVDLSAANSLFIGSDPNQYWPLNGFVDDVRIYNRALSAEEIARLTTGNQPLTASGTYTLGSSLTVKRSLILAAGSLDVSVNNYNITASGDFLIHGGIFTPRSGSVTLDGVDQAILSGGNDLSALSVASSSGVTLNDGLTITSSLTIGSGSTLSLAGYTLTGTTITLANSGNIDVHTGKIIHLPSSLLLADSTSAEQGSFTSGEIVYIVLNEGDENVDASVAESVTVTLTTTEGDSESLILTETGNATGIFQSSISTAENDGTVHANNNVIEVTNDGSTTMTVTFTDADDGLTSTDTAVLIGAIPTSGGSGNSGGGGGGGGGWGAGTPLRSSATDAAETVNGNKSEEEGSYPWSDFRPSHAHADAALKLHNAGIVRGNDDGTIQLNRSLSRVEAITLLIRTLGTSDDENIALRFPDIDPNAWYASPLRTALSLRLARGYPDGTFRPSDQLNLAESLKLISIALGLASQAEERDAEHWYDPYIVAARNTNLIEGDIEPDRFVSRGEFFSWLLMIMTQRNGAIAD